jgi:undecaprenyl-diphosphatase
MYYLNTLLAFITHHPGLAYGLIFLVSLSESLALVGLLVPGTMIMFGVGAIVALGGLGLAPVLLLAMVGAMAGDGISYWLGRHYKERLAEFWPFLHHPEMLKKGEEFFHRHGGKSVLFGRFVGPIRPVIPIVAGMLGMRPAHFGVVNVLSAIGWAFVYVLPGVFFGTSLAVAGAVSTRLAVLVSILVAGMWGLIWSSRKIGSLLAHKGLAWLSALKEWAAQDSRTQGRMPLVKRFFSFLFLRQQGEELLLGFLVLTLFVAGWGFLGVLQDVLAKDPLVLADQAVYHFFQSLRTPWADSALVAITELGDSVVNIVVFGAVLIVLLVKRCYRSAGFWALAVLGGLLGVQLLKWAIHLPRPVAIYQGASAYGFPSGHTTMSVILYGFLAILLAKRLAGTWRWGGVSGAVAVSFVIGTSRLYLGAHWLSDVLGGLLIGTSWAALLGVAYVKSPPEIVPRRLLGLVVIVVVVIAGGWHISQRHESDLAFYSPRPKVRTMPLATWQANGWRELPTWRIDLAGEREQPLTLQWSGSPDELAGFLMSKGWQRPPSLGMRSVLGMFSPNTPLVELPALPHLHDGRAERLRLVHMDQEKRLVLRLWSSDITISRDDRPLFIGTVEEQGRQQLAALLTATRNTGDYERPLRLMEQTVGDEFSVKPVRRTDHGTRADREQQRSRWRGRVLLIW